MIIFHVCRFLVLRYANIEITVSNGFDGALGRLGFKLVVTLHSGQSLFVILPGVISNKRERLASDPGPPPVPSPVQSSSSGPGTAKKRTGAVSGVAGVAALPE